LAAAIAARQAGFSVALADMAVPPIDKACGEGIMPDGLAALSKLGLAIPAESAAIFRGIRFCDQHSSVEARFAAGHGYGVRRTTLHEILVRKAGEAGVRMHWGAKVNGLTPSGITIHGQNIRCRWVVGADGQNSRIRRWAGLEPAEGQIRHRFGFRRHYRVKPWSEFVEVHWTQLGQFYVTPVGEEDVCVAFLTHLSHTRLDDSLKSAPELAERLRNAQPLTREQGALSATHSLPSVYRGSRVLVGEASGSVDAITGDGLSISFQQAAALATALQKNDLADYAAAHREIKRLPRNMARLMLLMDQNSWIRRRALRALASDPTLFARMLAIHPGAASPLEFGAQGTLSLGWHLLTA
jgi:flavin-dependent dehydrogenase